jgi:hypothetical protein
MQPPPTLTEKKALKPVISEGKGTISKKIKEKC